MQGPGWNIGWTWTSVVLGIVVVVLLAPVIGKLTRK